MEAQDIGLAQVLLELRCVHEATRHCFIEVGVVNVDAGVLVAILQCAFRVLDAPLDEALPVTFDGFEELVGLDLVLALHDHAAADGDTEMAFAHEADPPPTADHLPRVAVALLQGIDLLWGDTISIGLPAGKHGVADLWPANGLLAALVNQLAKLKAAAGFVRRAQVALALEAVVDVAAHVRTPLGLGEARELILAHNLADAKGESFAPLGPDALKLLDEFAGL